eukprot:4553603-Pyramimonas_sp.AAC.2
MEVGRDGGGAGDALPPSSRYGRRPQGNGCPPPPRRRRPPDRTSRGHTCQVASTSNHVRRGGKGAPGRDNRPTRNARPGAPGARPSGQTEAAGGLSSAHSRHPRGHWESRRLYGGGVREP